MADAGGDTARWMIDSGTSIYMTPHRSVFVNFRQCILPVSTATGDVFCTEGYGDMILKLFNQDQTESLPSLTLKKVWLAPELNSSLISMSALDKDDIGTWTKNGFMTFKHPDQLLDFREVYDIVAKPMSFEIFTAIAAAKGWFLHHVDIRTAFLYAELKEPIEIELPEGLEEEHPGCIGLLQKTIYGLKQSPREYLSYTGRSFHLHQERWEPS
ncbi:hypothetical protein N7534_001772 [Penicillium rubens]|nr:hypothetical protein N7534_001772 [Penicillium rubens]